MQLLDGLSKEVQKHLVEKSKGILETDEHCDIHPRYNKMLLPNGDLVCPVCYRDMRDGVISDKKTKEYYADTVEGKRKYLYENSVVSNKQMLDKGFKTYFTKSEIEKETRKKAEFLVHSVASGEPITVYLQGKPGVGKSHLAMAMLKNANATANGKRCLYINFPTLQQRIRASYNSEYNVDTEASFIKQMIAADILVLDDIASEIDPNALKGRVSDFSARILYSVLDGRAEVKPTIITSNISWDQLKSILDPRVTSRMSFRLKIIGFGSIQDKRSKG